MARNELRIISGKWKGRKLRFTDRPQLRPTLGRARETLFNWLGGNLAGQRCLDLFAGSGALGFEATSRGALHTVLVEKDRVAAEALRNNAALLGDDSLEVISTDAQRFLKNDTRTWDLVFLDPPFRSSLLEDVLPNLAGRLSESAVVYWEAASEPRLPAWLETHKIQKTGDSWSGLARFTSGEPLD